MSSCHPKFVESQNGVLLFLWSALKQKLKAQRKKQEVLLLPSQQSHGASVCENFDMHPACRHFHGESGKF